MAAPHKPAGRARGKAPLAILANPTPDEDMSTSAPSAAKADQPLVAAPSGHDAPISAIATVEGLEDMATVPVEIRHAVHVEPAEAPTAELDAVAPAAPEPEPSSIERSVDAAAAPLIDSVSKPTDKGPIPMATSFDTIPTNPAMADMNDRAKGAMEKGVKFAEDMTEFTKGNLEALVTSGRVAAKGIETMAQDAAETAKTNFENASTAMKGFTQVKSPTELFQMQSDLMRSAFDQMVAIASKTSEQMMKLTGDVVQPLSNRYAVAAEKMKSPAL